MAPWGADSIAHPRYPNEDDSALGIHLHHPHLSRHRHPSLAHLRILPFAVGDIFIALSIAWVILYPIYEIRLRKKRVFGRVAEYLLWVYAWFYIAWGLNYSQPNIYYRIGMKPVEVSKAKFKKFAYQYADSLNALSNASLSNARKSISLIASWMMA